MEPIETERLTIRPFTLDDVPDIHRILDLELKWAGEPLPIEDRRHIILSHIMAYDSYAPLGFGYRAVCLKTTGELVGTCNLHPGLLDPSARSALFGGEESDGSLEVFLGYALSPSRHGNGYGCEAASAMAAHALNDWHLGAIFAETSDDNRASIRLMERIGMRVVSSPRPGWDDRIVGVLEKS